MPYCSLPNIFTSSCQNNTPFYWICSKFYFTVCRSTHLSTTCLDLSSMLGSILKLQIHTLLFYTRIVPTVLDYNVIAPLKFIHHDSHPLPILPLPKKFKVKQACLHYVQLVPRFFSASKAMISTQNLSKQNNAHHHPSNTIWNCTKICSCPCCESLDEHVGIWMASWWVDRNDDMDHGLFRYLSSRLWRVVIEICRRISSSCKVNVKWSLST